MKMKLFGWLFSLIILTGCAGGYSILQEGEMGEAPPSAPSPWKVSGGVVVPVNPSWSVAMGAAAIGVTAHGTVATGTVTLTPGVHSITVAGDQTWAFSGWPAVGLEGKITVYVTNGGSATITGLAGPIYSGGGEPALTAAGRDVLIFSTIDGGTTVHMFLSGLDMK